MREGLAKGKAESAAFPRMGPKNNIGGGLEAAGPKKGIWGD